MGRWAKLDTVTAKPESSAIPRPTAPAVPAIGHDPKRAASADRDAAADVDHREEILRLAAIHLSGPWSDQARQQAMHLRLRTTVPATEKNDIAAYAELARYLQRWAIGHGYLDVTHALTGVELARWVHAQRASGMSAGTVRTRRARLVEVARLLHPHDFRSGRSESAVAQSNRVSPVSEADMRLIQHYAPMTPDDLRTRFDTIFAIVPWTGARPAELRQLRGSDIHRRSTPIGDIAVVSLTNHRGKVRHIPVVDRSAAERLLALGDRYGDRPVVGTHDRNALNRCREHLQRRGVTVDFTVDRLRSTWLIRLSHQRIPLALALYLADTWDTRVFRELAGHLPVYDQDQAIDLLTGTDHSHPTSPAHGGQ